MSRAFIALQYLLPKKILTRLAGRLSYARNPTLKNFLINNFINYFKIDLAEAVIENANEFPDFNNFFIRKLKPSARTWQKNANHILSPVDGYLSQYGKIEAGNLIQAKNRTYTLQALLANDKARTAEFLHGEFMTLYLAPHNYHRVHMPCAGTLTHMTYVPGRLFSVNTKTVNGVANLFARNERVIAYFDTALGPLAVIFVGAVIVGSIHTQWAGQVVPHHSNKIVEWDYRDQTHNFQQGDEIGYFTLGSTIILLFGQAQFTMSPNLQQDTSIKLGELLATV